MRLFITASLLAGFFASPAGALCYKQVFTYDTECGETKVSMKTVITNDVTNPRNINMMSKEECDLGLKLPGLPDFNLNFDFSLPSACKALRVITGGLVMQINDRLQNELDSMVDSVTNGNTELDFNLQDNINEALENAGSGANIGGGGSGQQGNPFTGGNNGRGGYDNTGSGNGGSGSPGRPSPVGQPIPLPKPGANPGGKPPPYKPPQYKPPSGVGGNSGGGSAPVGPPSNVDYLTGKPLPKPKPGNDFKPRKKPPQKKPPEQKPPENNPDQVCVYGDCG